MERIPTITQGCDFTFRISARRIGYKNFVKVYFEEITNIVANLISLPSKKTPVSSSIDDAGRLIISIDGQTLDCTMYGLELIGFYNNGNWRHQIAPAVEIVKSSAQDNYALVESDDLTIDIEITLGETTVSSRVLNTVMEEHNTSKASHQDIRQEISDLAEDQLAMASRLVTAEQAITAQGQDIEQLKEDVQEAGKVNDVLLNGQSILGQDKIARIDLGGYSDAIENLQQQIDTIVADKASVSLTASPNTIYSGEQNNIILTAKVTGATASSITILKSGTVMISDTNKSQLGATDTVSTSSNVNYTAIFVINGVTKSAAATVNVVGKIYYGTGNSAAEANTVASKRTSPAGTYSVTVAVAGAYIFFVVPNNMYISSATMSGFDFPLDAPSTMTKEGSTYKVYKSSSPMDAGSYEIIIK